MITIITSFFAEYKLAIIKYAIILGLVVFSILYIYNKGYSAGESSEKERIVKEYNDVLAKKLKQNTDRMNREFSEKAKTQEKEIVREIVYVEREKKVKVMIEKSPNLTDPKNALAEDQAKLWNEVTRRVK